MVEQIELGQHGLYYLTDTETPGVFIAATSATDASELAVLARRALPVGADIPGHIMHDHDNGARITVPDPHPMTEKQRRETIGRFTKHLRERLFS
jgi:hypothetical protein